MSLGTCLGSRGWAITPPRDNVGNSLLDASATMNAYDSIERGAADECEPLRGRRPRTFTLTQLLVACVAVCVCSIAATTAVHRLSQEEPPDIEPRPDPPEPLDEPFRKAATTVVNTHQGPSRLANFDSGSAFDDDSALANFDDDSDSDSDSDTVINELINHSSL